MAIVLLDRVRGDHWRESLHDIVFFPFSLGGEIAGWHVLWLLSFMRGLAGVRIVFVGAITGLILGVVVGVFWGLHSWASGWLQSEGQPGPS
ncbi:hypothetical protein ACO2Q3_26435 [Caulobacter sp. KR2-114]|uniref:hypothetical protein n=1 Tax=Caulobacter sp. KR2-114 TaxID=3400912 RepID=UPI003C0026F7